MQALDYYQQAAKKGSEKAVCALGRLYLAEPEGRRHPEKGLELYRQAAGQGCAEAMFLLGRCLETGDLLEQDLDAALQQYRDASARRHGGAMCALGRFYEEGIHVEQSLQSAFLCYLKAAEWDDLEGGLRLARCLFEGIGTDPDPDAARSICQELSGPGVEDEERFRKADAAALLRRIDEKYPKP